MARAHDLRFENYVPEYVDKRRKRETGEGSDQGGGNAVLPGLLGGEEVGEEGMVTGERFRGLGMMKLGKERGGKEGDDKAGVGEGVGNGEGVEVDEGDEDHDGNEGKDEDAVEGVDDGVMGKGGEGPAGTGPEDGGEEFGGGVSGVDFAFAGVAFAVLAEVAVEGDEIEGVELGVAAGAVIGGGEGDAGGPAQGDGVEDLAGEESKEEEGYGVEIGKCH